MCDSDTTYVSESDTDTDTDTEVENNKIKNSINNDEHNEVNQNECDKENKDNEKDSEDKADKNKDNIENFELNLIFLPDKYKKKSRWTIRKNDLIENLENLGVKVVYTSDIEMYTKSKIYTFNDNNYPVVNTLYIHLFNGAYYCDKHYSSKKLEKEREIIFLLSGKLGVSEIKYKIENSNINISGINASTNIEKFKLGASYDKKINSSREKSYIERYSNRGAPVYTLCKNLDQVEENFRYNFNKLNPKVFSYNFYKSSNKLTTFVFKRFNFKMVSLNYDTESEDIYDKTLEIKILLMSYGLGMKIRNYMYTMQKISYDMVFFSDQELRLELDKIIQLNEDPFYQTREIYDSVENKDIAVYSITQYVREYAKDLKYKINDNEYNFSEKLNIWIENNPEDFIEICHTFMSTYQIETWLLSKLKLNSNEDYIEPEKKSYNICGINEIKKDNYNKYKKRLLLENGGSNQTDDSNIDIYNCSDLDIAKLEQKLENQQKIIEETKNNINKLEEKHKKKNLLNSPNQNQIQLEIISLQDQLKLQTSINEKMNEKLELMNHNNSDTLKQCERSSQNNNNNILDYLDKHLKAADKYINEQIRKIGSELNNDIARNLYSISREKDKFLDDINQRIEQLESKNIMNKKTLLESVDKKIQLNNDTFSDIIRAIKLETELRIQDINETHSNKYHQLLAKIEDLNSKN